MNREQELGLLVVDLVETLQRKLQRKDEEAVRVAALCGDTKAQRQVLIWDEEDGMEDVPMYLPNGDRITKVSELAAALGVSERIAAMFALERPGAYDDLRKDANDILSSINTNENNNVYLALLPSEEFSGGIDGGIPKDDLHMTLYYSSELEGPVDIEALMAELVSIPFRQIEGQPTGVCVFPSHGDAPRRPLVQLVTSADIEDLRFTVINKMRSMGLRRDRTYGFIPHITLAYVEDGNKKSLAQYEQVSQPIVFDRLLVTAPGFKEVIDLPESVAATQDELEIKPTGIVEG